MPHVLDYFRLNGRTALCPGPFATEMNRPLLNDPAQYAAFVANIPMGPPLLGAVNQVSIPKKTTSP